MPHRAFIRSVKDARKFRMCDFEVNGDGVQLISALAQLEYRYKLFSSAKRIMRWRASIKGLVRRYFFVVVSEQSG